MHIKSIIAAVITIVLMSCTHAYAQASNEEICNEISGIAGIIMKYRQQGVEFSNMFGAAARNDAMYGGQLEQNLVRIAFTYPRVMDYSARDAVIAGFKERVYNDCMKVRTRNKD